MAPVCLNPETEPQQPGLIVQRGPEQTRNILGASGVEKLCDTNVLQGERVELILHDPERQEMLPMSATIDHEADFDLVLSDWHYGEFERVFCEPRICKMLPVRFSKKPDPGAPSLLFPV